MKYKAFLCGEFNYEFSDKDAEAMDFMNRQLKSDDYDGMWEFEDEEGHLMVPENANSKESCSSTDGDYGPETPWDAPGMSISDFI